MNGRIGRYRILVALALVLSVLSARSAGATLSVGGFGGKVWTVEKRAAKGDVATWATTSLGNAESAGGNVGILWDLYPRTKGGIEIEAQQFKADFTNLGATAGELKGSPVLVQAKVQTFPRDNRGLATHFSCGVGVMFSDFTTGPSHLSGGTASTADTDESLAFAVGGGLDYFFTKNIALATIESEFAELGTELSIETTVEHKRHSVTAMVSKPQFFNPERKVSNPKDK